MATAAVKSSPGWSWAQAHALPSQDARAAMQFQARLERSQFLPADETLRYQLMHLGNLLRHAGGNISFWRERLRAAGLADAKAITLEQFQALPPLTRGEVQSCGAQMQTAVLPQGHGQIHKLRTSGSTGSPVETAGTDLTATWHQAITFRSLLWACKNFAGKMAVIRQLGGGADVAQGETLAHWADEVTIPVETGPAVRLGVGQSLTRQAQWLNQEKPELLFTYPSNLHGLLRAAENGSARLPRLKQIMTIGETLELETRLLARRLWQAEIFDIYSAEEVGYIALQCPSGGGYHLQAEAALVEILDDAGRPCRPAGIGRVVVTPLFNYAMPLLRYEIGDYAEMAAPCRCGRGLPTVKRILGRRRNLLLLTDGTRHWPSFGTRRFLDLAPIRQHQFVQTGIDVIEARLVVERALTDAEEKQLAAHVMARLPAPFKISFVYVDQIPRSAAGKYEDFMSLLDRADQDRTA
jgi:phenylacetate-CoA ligase